MTSSHNIIVPLTLLACFWPAHAFFTSYNKKNADMRSGGNAQAASGAGGGAVAPPLWYREAFPPWQPFTFDSPRPVAVAVPVAVPMHAQMAGGSQFVASLDGNIRAIQNAAQLMPCLCPVGQDGEPPRTQIQPGRVPQTAYVVQASPVQPSPVQPPSQDM